MTRRRWMMVYVIAAILVLIGGACAAGQAGLFSGQRPELGIEADQLKPCPDSPNCVNSRADDARHAIEPIQYHGDAHAAQARLRSIIESAPRARVIESRPGYLRAEYTTRLMRFVDDVEFQFVPEQSVIHVRSASRLGYSDLGVNRKRIESLRDRFQPLK